MAPEATGVARRTARGGLAAGIGAPSRLLGAHHAEATPAAPRPVRVRLAAGILALNRFMMTLQNKRMPVADVKVDAGAEGTSIMLGFDCPEETARRAAGLAESTR